MKKCLLFTALFFLCTAIFSQTVPPNTRMMQVNTVKGSAISLVELSDNFAYHIGTTNSSEIGFDGLSANTVGLDDLYILKSNISSGSNVWFKTFNAGNKGVITPRYSYVDAAENLYVFGQFKGKITAPNTSINSVNESSAFLMKIFSDGTIAWVNILEGNYNSLFPKVKCVTDGTDTFLIYDQNHLLRVDDASGSIIYDKLYETGVELKSVALKNNALYVAGGTRTISVIGSQGIPGETGFIVKGDKDALFTRNTTAKINTDNAYLGGATDVNDIAIMPDGQIVFSGFSKGAMSIVGMFANHNYTYNPNTSWANNRIYHYVGKMDGDFNDVIFLKTSSPVSSDYIPGILSRNLQSKITTNANNFRVAVTNNYFDIRNSITSFTNPNGTFTGINKAAEGGNSYKLSLSFDNTGSFLQGIQPYTNSILSNGRTKLAIAQQANRLFTSNVYESSTGAVIFSKEKTSSIGGTLKKHYQRHLKSAKNDLFLTTIIEGKANFFGKTINNPETPQSRYITRLGSDGLAKWFAEFSNDAALDEVNYSGDYACVDGNDHLIFLANTKGAVSTFTDASGNATNFQQDANISSKAIIKIDQNGLFQWKKQLIPSEPAIIKASVSTDALGNVYVSGTTNKTFSIDGNTISVAENTSFFILKFNESGDLIYTNAYPNLGAYSINPVFDAQNNFYLFSEPTKYSEGDYVFDQISVESSSIYRMDHLLLKFNDAGKVIFAKNFYKNADPLNAAYSWPNDVQFDGSDFIVMGDYYRERTTMDYVGLDMVPIPKIYETGTYTPFIAKVKTDGTVLWQKPLHVNNSITGAYTNIDVDEDKNIYMTWNAKDKVSYNGTEYQFDALIGNKILTKISTAGVLQYFKKIDVNNTFYPVTDVIGNDRVNVSGFTLSNQILNYPIAYNRASSLYIATFGNLDGYYLTPTKDYMVLSETAMPNNPNNANTFSFDLINNTDWNAASDQSWLNLSFLSLTEKNNFKNSISGNGDAQIIISADTNNTGANRSANVVVNGTGVDSKTIIITQTLVLSAAEAKTFVTTLYPNPTSDVLNIETKQTISKIEIFDLSGKLLKSESGKDKKITVSQLAKGMYLIKLYTENGVVTSKFIKR